MIAGILALWSIMQVTL